MNATPCPDFESFAHIFARPHFSTRMRNRVTGRLGDMTIAQGDMFILYGAWTYVARIGEDLRLRLICDDGTERNPTLRSFKRTLYRDKSVRRAIPYPEDAV
jgi:hypothetical protein